MKASYHDGMRIKNTVSHSLSKITVSTVVILIALLFCLNNIVVHFLERWDGHFHDTKGCTSIQDIHGKLFKVNSCDSAVENIEIKEDEALKGFENITPDEPMAANIKPNPQKKIARTKETSAVKQNPYMV
jgi:hypothetical protein